MADVRQGLPNPTQYVMINNYLIDVSIKEGHAFDAEVTDFPVESGSSFSDNIRKKPITVMMEGLVSNKPIGDIIDKRRSAGAPATNFSTLSIVDNHAQEAYAVLLAVWGVGEPVTIRTSLGTFERMALTSLNVPRDAQTGDVLYFTASFQQIQVVTNERIRKRTATRTGKKRDLGPQPGVEKNQPLIIWNKGRNSADTAYEGGGSWYGEQEQLVMANVPGHGRDICHIGNASIDNFAGNNNTAPGTTGGSWTVNYTPLNAGEKVRLQKDRARDEARRQSGQSLRDKTRVKKLFGGDGDSKRPTADMSERNRTSAAREWTGRFQ